MQLFKYFDFNQSTMMVTAAINVATKDLLAFSFMFFVVFLAFVQYGYVVFGAYMQDFSTFPDSMYAITLASKNRFNTLLLIVGPNNNNFCSERR